MAIGSSLLLSGCGSADDQRPAQWSYIYPAIIEPSCATASCHSDFTRRAGVNFGFSDEAYFQLTARHFVVMCPTTGMPPVVDPTCSARAPGDSEVVHLMRAEGASRMPPDFALPDVDIRLIETWITMGAQQD
ncbi:MAG TPA: hypothetical protein VG319_05725 [Polyangia bacterium]|nr:hypothetical protein [Polyangia bacterium]